MNNIRLDFEEFVTGVHNHFAAHITREGVESLLRLEEDYNKDSPTSPGKALLLNRLIFSGKKLSGEEFIHDQNLFSGINVWIADNLKGKSTIFKILKHALTGVDSIKPDIKKWINEIILEFKIGNRIYTVYVDKTGRDSGALYSFGIEKFLDLKKNQKLDTIEKEKEFDFRSNGEFESKMQDFFFEHFSFYTLKYTAKNSSKENFELSTANLSWSTYFKSIYLESSNYKFLFFDNEKYGAQGRKIFEMVLGLRLTYPINMLGIQRDRISEAIGKLKLLDKSRNENNKSQTDKLSNKYTDVVTNLEKIKTGGIIRFDTVPLIEEYNRIQTRINDNRKKTRTLSDDYEAEKNRIDLLQTEIQSLEHDQSKINEEINRLSRQELNLELFKDAEGFFSNLDIKACPHCEVEVSENKREKERETHVCSLCGETSTQQKIEIGELQSKLDRIIEEKLGHQGKLVILEGNIRSQKAKLEELNQSALHLYSKLVAVPSANLDIDKLKEIEEQINTINKERVKQKDLFDKKDQLIRDEAVLKYQLEQIEKEKSINNTEELDKLVLKKEILEFSLQSLEKRRMQMNKDILDKLQELILKEIHAFGIPSINKVEINDNYDLVVIQNEVPENFNELAEGEKLRVKLAFYLSLIQMDIEHNLGRHPRFLIFDSPGGEEMIEKHLHGLSDILKNVNMRFQDKLQIFVGSALREFTQITSPEKSLIKQDEEFVF